MPKQSAALHSHRVSAMESGMTLLEIMVAAGVMFVLMSAAFPKFNDWQDNQRSRTAARAVAEAFNLARSSAIRSGSNHVVFFRVNGVTMADSAGTDIADQYGNPVPILIINDGPAAAANCQIDPGETIQTWDYQVGTVWGTNTATANAPLDANITDRAQGVTFASPTNPATAVIGVLFRGDGIPVTFSGDAILGCNVIGDLGTGSGAIYLTGGKRDYAVVLTPVGTTRLHVWNAATASWSN